jgi:hypothetical protein
MKKEHDKEEFETTDLGLASVLFAKQFELSDLDRSNPNRVKFKFKNKDSQKAVTAAQEYRSSDLEVNAKRYWESMKTLKNLIYK